MRPLFILLFTTLKSRCFSSKRTINLKYIQSLNEFLHLQAMVQEPESRFCSDQQTILQVLDPIHRSLLINNSEFESRLYWCYINIF